MRTLSFNEFDGGMTNDPRDPRENVCRSIKHFDNYTRAHKLTPHRSMKLDATIGDEDSLHPYEIKKFLVGNNTLWGLGIKPGTGHTQIYTKATLSDPTSLWTTAPGTFPNSGAETYLLFALYHNRIYGSTGAAIWSYGDIAGTPSFNQNESTLFIPTGQGIVHSKYDILYVPSGNKLYQNDLHSGSGWSLALTLPTNCSIKSLCENGNFLAIAVDQPDDTSTVYLWDTQTTLNDLSEKIDWGNGSIKLIETIGGVLCGISTTSNTSTSLIPRVLFKYYTGSRVVTFEQFVCSHADIITGKQKYNDLFYFLADITIDSVVYNGLWKIYKNPTGNMAVSFDMLPRNDEQLPAGRLNGFVRMGDFIFISYITAESIKYTIWRTDDQNNFAATSVFESVINPVEPERYRQGAGIRANKKQLMGVALSTEALKAGQVARLFIRTDAGDWEKVIESSALGAIVKENTFTSAGKRIKNGREHEYRVESQHGAEITDVKWKVEVNETQL